MKKQFLCMFGVIVFCLVIAGVILAVPKEKLEEKVTLELKDSYKLEEVVKITVTHKFDNSLYIYSDDYPYYKIYKLENKTWKEFPTFILYGCYCKDETLHCPLLIPELPKCMEIKDKRTFDWDQEINPYTSAKCGNETYRLWEEKMADSGNYKVEFCYYKKKDVELYENSCVIIGNATCIEKEFIIERI